MSSLQSRLDQLARSQPESIALVRHSTRCTFSGLNELANHAGRELIRMSVKPETVVAVWSTDPVMQVALTFGVWKAGLTGVVLDVRDSQPRLRWMLDSAGIDAVITDGESVGEVSQLTSTIPILPVDQNGFSASSPEVESTPGAPALIMFISGDEGRSKGVVKTHQELLQECRYHESELALDSTDRVAQIHPLNFFSGLKYALTSLLSDSPLYFYDVVSQGLTPFSDWSRREGITVIPCTVAFLRRLLHHAPDPDHFARCRCVVVGGEKLYKRDVDAFQRMFPESCKLIYVYGATECGSISQYVISEDTLVTDPVPAGTLVEDKQVRFFKVKKHQRLYFELPVGEVGQIAVFGSNLPSGYWKDPEMNGSKYRSSPDNNGKRMYMPGDSGRIGEDGLLYLHSRDDRQVKIHGYRVDLSEVEFALSSDENVASAVVMMTEDDSREPRLIAYVVLSDDCGDRQALLGEIRNTAATDLPGYMVPDQIVALDAMPTTHVGKANPQGLSTVPLSTETKENGALSATENKVLEVWRNVFKQEDICVDDDVLDLGVSSLQAMETCVILGNKFSIEIPFTQLVLSPTVRQVSAFIDARLAERMATE